MVFVIIPYYVNVDRLLCHAQVKMPLFSSIRGRICERSRVRDISEATVVFICQFLVLAGQFNLGQKDSVSVRVTFLLLFLFGFPLLLAKVPLAFSLADHPYVTVCHRLTKQVLGLNPDSCVLARQIILTIGLNLYREIWQLVTTDANI